MVQDISVTTLDVSPALYRLSLQCCWPLPLKTGSALNVSKVFPLIEALHRF